jgi:hypothetical protein
LAQPDHRAKFSGAEWDFEPPYGKRHFAAGGPTEGILISEVPLANLG